MANAIGPLGAVGLEASRSLTVTILWDWVGLAADAAGATPSTSRTDAHAAARERFNNVNTNFDRGRELSSILVRLPSTGQQAKATD